MSGGAGTLPAALRREAERLAGAGILRARRLPGGRNARVHRLDLADGRTVVLKRYPPAPPGARDRMEAEWAALSLMREFGFDDVPEPLARHPPLRFALLSFLDGEPPSLIRTSDIDGALAFLARLNLPERRARAADFAPAAEACFSLDALAENLALRRRRLAATLPRTEPETMLTRFLTRAFDPLLEERLADAREATPRREKPVPRSAQILSPSDFGFHNALRRAGGLVFLDFEHFGWDDPAKTVADFLLHPGMTASRTMRARFAAGLSRRLDRTGRLALRTKRLLPLFQLKWCMILLNEFVPEDDARRRHAGATEDRMERLAAQLHAAEAMLYHLPPWP